MNKKNIVVVGGGNGTAISLFALKRHLEQFTISGITSMMDSGGSSGKLRKELGVLPTGDILRGILALSKHEYAWLRPMFYEQRFEETGKLTGHNLGNLFLAFASQYAGSLPDAVNAFQQALECVGNILPVTLDSVQLVAELMDGTLMVGEAAIDRPPIASADIKRAWLEPEAKLYEPARQVLVAADYIVLGPGSLYTSLVPNFLTVGFSEALKQSKAKLVYVLGLAYENNGEKGPTSMSELTLTLEKYLPRKVDIIIHNTHELLPLERANYAKEHWSETTRDVEKVADGRRLIGCDLELDGGGLSKEKLAEAFEKYLV
ncbi:MAG: YvcK family protein [Candidatus Magasanikbacteria bacterium]|nr:YvcK family protein [Candidatus Magasanikbacteria bacterium]